MSSPGVDGVESMEGVEKESEEEISEDVGEEEVRRKG
jgi:hypothetical protein